MLSLDDYPAWLKEQELRSGRAEQTPGQAPAKQINKKQQRQEQAQRRQRLKPLYDKVREIETLLTSSRSELESLDERLTDESIYADSGRQAELTQLVQAQAGLRSEIERLEEQWLDASETLETENQ